MDNLLRARANAIVNAAIQAVQPDDAVKRALSGQDFPGKILLVSAGKRSITLNP